jgi:eukaryotic-like serine/threonine-protein kinase
MTPPAGHGTSTALPADFGRYKLLRRLAVGGMAEVFLARSTGAFRLKKLLVIKQIHPAFAQNAHFVSQFIDEAKIALSLNHPNIVQVFDFGKVDDCYFLAMEHVAGVDLLDLLRACDKQSRRIPFGMAAYIGQQIATALDYAHRKTDEFGQPLQIVHRDVSPQNIIVSYEGSVKLLDFGIAKARDSAEEKGGTIKGKYAYMSPEQASGKSLDHRSDLFSLGILLYELSLAKPLFSGKRGPAALGLVREAKIPNPQTVDGDYPPQLASIVMRALSLNVDDRYHEARDLQRDLGHFLLGIRELQGPEELAALVNDVAPSESDELPNKRRPTAERQTGTLPRLQGEVPRATVRERKNIVAMAGKFHRMELLSEDLDPEHANRFFIRFKNVAEDIVYKNHAHIVRLDLDGFLLALGIPVSTEDDSSRAIRVARVLLDALDNVSRELPRKPSLSVGIQRGRATLSSEAPPNLQFDIDPATLQSAEAMAQYAKPTEIIVGGGAYRLARVDFQFEQVPDAVSTPDGTIAKAYRFIRPIARHHRTRQRSTHHFVGRELELRQLRAAYRQTASTRSSRSIAIIGHFGMGKHTLVEAFLRQLDSETFVLRTTGHPTTSDQPFSIVEDLLRELLVIDENDAPQVIQKKISDGVKTLGAVSSAVRTIITQTLYSALGISADDIQRHEGEPPRRQHRLLLALRHLLFNRARSQPVVLVARNLHLVDPDSTSLLLSLLHEQPAPILSLLTSRSVEGMKERMREAKIETIELAQLNRTERRKMVTDRLATDDPHTDKLVDRILERTAGNPLFIAEMIDSLTERGVLEPDLEVPGCPLRWKKEDAELRIPTTVEGIVASRIDALDDDQKATLLQASALGTRFRSSMLSRFTGQDLGAFLQQLASRGLLRHESADIYTFTNQLTLEVAYNLIPRSERQELHKRIAEEMLANPRRNDENDEAEIARHWELAGDRQLAMTSYLKSASHARRRCDYGDALRLYNRAFRIIEPKSEAALQVFSARAYIYRLWGRRQDQLREIRRLRRTAIEAKDSRWQDLAENCLARFYIDVGRPTDALEVLAELAINAECESVDVVVESIQLKAEAEHASGNSSAAQETIASGLLHCGTERESLPLRAALLQTEGSLLSDLGELRKALSSLAEAWVITHRLKLHGEEAAILESMGHTSMAMGEVSNGMNHFRRALTVAQTFEDQVALGRVLTSISHALADLGDTEKALPYLGRALQLNEALGNRQATAKTLTTMGQLHLRGKNQPAAQALLRRGYQVAKDNGDAGEQIRALVYLSLWALDSQQPDEALEFAKRTQALAETHELSSGRIHGFVAEGLARVQRGESEAAVKVVNRAVALARSESVNGMEEVLFRCAIILNDAGHQELAKETLADAHERVQKYAETLPHSGWRKRYLAKRPVRELMKLRLVPNN